MKYTTPSSFHFHDFVKAFIGNNIDTTANSYQNVGLSPWTVKVGIHHLMKLAKAFISDSSTR